MKIYRNFLSKVDFKNLEQLIMDYNFPWFFSKVSTVGKGNYYRQFEHTFILEKGIPNTTEYALNILKPLFNKLNCREINRVKANLLWRDCKITEHSMHVDQEVENGKTAVLYINTCNGYTKFKNGEKIKSERNKCVEFDSKLKHTGSSCTNKDRRVTLNINYI
tara:strand:- start:4918 stop:5406 length:489 start_codon:yes stop_codon:yes gene_type:complete